MTNISSFDIAKQAADWAIRLEEDSVTEKERELFRAWIANPVNEQAYLEQVQIGELARRVKLRANTPGIGVVVSDEVLAYRSEKRIAPRRLRHAALAAALLITVAVAWFLSSPQPRSVSFSTATREVRTVNFEDGSKATMNTRSELIWIGSSKDRRVLLKKGEALFNVTHDANRPFRVLIGDRDEVRVVGTDFNVYRKADASTVVSVLAGRVEVIHRDMTGRIIWTRNLSTDQQLRYQATGVPLLRPVGASRAVRWTEGELDVDESPLSEVVAELGRYTDARIVLSPDSRLERTYVGGVLSVQNIDTALALLQKRAPITVTRNDGTGEYTLSYREQPSRNPSETELQ